MPLPQWRALEPVQRAEMAAHLRLRSLRERWELEHTRKEAGAPKPDAPRDVGMDMMKAMGGLRKK